MNEQFDKWQLPLRLDEHGDVRVGKSRVLLDTVIYGHRQGDAPERIATQFPTLELPDVYAAIAYYLRNRDEVDAYILAREKAGEKLRRDIAEHAQRQIVGSASAGGTVLTDHMS